MWATANNVRRPSSVVRKPKLVYGIPYTVYGLLLLVLMGCGSVDPVVKIGMVAPFEGAERAIGYDVIYSARLAVRQINEAGGVNGVRLSLVAYNDSTFPDEAANVAEALVIDPNIVAVIGHWHPETTNAAQPFYEAANLAFIPMGAGRFGTADPTPLDPAFREAYQATSFQGLQAPGAYAGTAYDAMQLIIAAIEHAISENDEATRANVHIALPQVEIEGITGSVSLP